MSWPTFERGGRLLWSGLLIFFVICAQHDIFAVAGLLGSREDNGPAIWRILGFPNLRAYFESSGEEIFLLLFALAGLWLRQRRRWLNWAWSMPLLFSIVLHAYIYP
jgi:hypothetical protein